MVIWIFIRTKHSRQLSKLSRFPLRQQKNGGDWPRWVFLVLLRCLKPSLIMFIDRSNVRLNSPMRRQRVQWQHASTENWSFLSTCSNLTYLIDATFSRCRYRPSIKKEIELQKEQHHRQMHSRGKFGTLNRASRFHHPHVERAVTLVITNPHAGRATGICFTRWSDAAVD